MNSKTIYSNTISDDGLHSDGLMSSSWAGKRKQSIFSTTGEIDPIDDNAAVTNNNVKNRLPSAKPRRVRQGFSGQWAPEFERQYPKPIDLDKTLGKAFRESQFYSQGFGYMSGGQWFNPFSLHPHPELEQKTNYGGNFGTFGFPGVTTFDAYLKIYGMMSDSMKNVTKYHMSVGGHMGLKLDTIKHGGKKRSKYFEQNLNVVSGQQLNNKKGLELNENDDTDYGLNTVWNIGQNDLGNKDKDTVDGHENKNNPTVKRSISDRRCKRRQLYCAIVNAFLFLNIIRMIACHFMVHKSQPLQDTVDGGGKDFDPMEGYIRGQGMKPPKGFGGLGVGDGPPDIYTRFLWGDLSPFWTRRPHMVTVITITLTAFALVINVCFEYFQSDRAKRWMVPFAVLTGQITPADARLRSKYQLDKIIQNVRGSFRIALLLTIIGTVFWSGFYFWSAMTFTEVPENLIEDIKNGLIYRKNPNRTSFFEDITGQGCADQNRVDGQSVVAEEMSISDNSPKLIQLGSYEISLFWATVNSLNAFYVTGIIIWSLTYFHCLTWYIRIRFKRLNKICYALLDLSSGIIPLVKRNDFMTELLHEHNLTSNDLTIYNRFWKWYLLVCHFFYVPITFWLVYVGTFYWQGTWIIKGSAWIVATLFVSFMAVMVASGETVSNQAHMLWRWLNTLCLYEWPIVIKFRMAYLIERIGGPTLGFTCYDFFVVARETFYEMALLLGTYFFLTYEFVLSSL